MAHYYRNSSNRRKSTPFRKKNAKGPHHCHLTLNTAARSSPTGPSESAQTQLDDTCVGSLSRTACSVQHCPGLQRKRRRAFRQIAVSSKRRDARVASPHNTQRAACSHPVPGKHSHPPRRRVVPYREERRVFRLSLAALPSELGKGEEHTQSVLSQEDDGLKMLAPP